MAKNLDACEISPVRADSKHMSTPRRTRSKTSRLEQGIDVHTSCSTPVTQRSPRFNNRSLNSPSPSFPYSQENYPDVVWDYSSPKLPKGAKRKELKLTVQELLENLNQCQVPECSTQSAPYIKLLERWMEKQTMNPVKKIEKTKKENKKRSRRVVEELKKFLETISRAKKEIVSANNPGKNEPETNTTPKLSTSIKPLFDGDSTDGDSTEELWGDMDNSFIVKATQDFELINPVSNCNQNADIISTIPETAPSASSTPESSPHKLSQVRCHSILDMEKCNDFLEQLSNIDWDSDLDTDEWENGFLAEEDTLSLVPDEVLTGTNLDGSNSTSTFTSLKNPCVETSAKLSLENAISNGSTKNISKETMYCVGSITDCSSQTQKQINSVELFNSFEDENFADESLFCQPEVLSQLDEVENMMSEHPKCTPEEIEKKKGEAIKRRYKTRLAKKST